MSGEPRLARVGKNGPVIDEDRRDQGADAAYCGSANT
jgi:hypothetical protein